MKILFVASEGAPFSASGGLGDVIGALPGAIKKNDPSIDVEVVLPLYKSTKEKYMDELKRVCDLNFRLSWRDTGATVYSIEKDGINYYFIENSYYFDREAFYGEFDDGERFAFFSMATLEFIMSNQNIPDIIHANDWQSALCVIYLKTKYRQIKMLSQIKTLYTIHNIEYQGKYNLDILEDIFALDIQFKNIVEYNGEINLTKGAITVSDYVSTVSPNYANELKHDYFAFGLANIISEASHKMCGIINGIDYSYFSPEVGGDIYSPYTRRAFKSGKAKNKKALQAELGLLQNPKIPLIIMISRLTDGKGIDLVLHVIEELLSENVQFAILGTGDVKYEDALRSIESNHDNFKAVIKFDRTLSKKMYAGADMFLMPSKSEPCGLAQMIACSYGTIPVVRAVGGLVDSIIPYGCEGANGFRFDNYNAHDLLYTAKSALNLYSSTKEWETLVKSAINSDFSWVKSAQKYIGLYKNLLVK